jgi:hypothetical protein
MTLDEERPRMPVDYVVIGFPVGVQSIPGMFAAELASLIENGIINVVDVLILEKGLDGEVRVHELRDLDAVREFEHVRLSVGDVVPRDGIDRLAATMEPGTSAGVLVWENTWADPFVARVRRTGCRIVSSGRIS